jgi:hypothetical protein
MLSEIIILKNVAIHLTEGSAFVLFCPVRRTWLRAKYTLPIWPVPFILFSVLPWQKFNPLRTCGCFVYHQFSIKKFYFLRTECVSVTFMDIRTTIIYLYKLKRQVFRLSLRNKKERFMWKPRPSVFGIVSVTNSSSDFHEICSGNSWQNIFDHLWVS